MATNPNSKQSLSSTCTALIAGFNALSGSDPFVSGGTSYTKAQALAPLVAYVPLPAATAAAKTAYSKAVAAESAAKTAVVAMIEDVLKPYLQTRLGKSSPDLVTYGLQPVKTPQTSAATKAAAAQKNQATRKALGTKGPDQKKAAIKALAAAPATAPASPASTTPTKS